MTGFGRAAGESENYRVSVSARSVNHRFLDLAIRVAEDHRELEADVRQLLDDRMARGRVEVRVTLEPLGEGAASVVVDKDVARAIQEAARDLSADAAAEPLSAADLLRLPEVVRIQRRQQELTAADRSFALGVAAEAVTELIRMREGEGGQLRQLLSERVRTLEELAERLGAHRAEVRSQLLLNMRQRLSELLDGAQFDEDRLAQEIALLAEKMDIQEELDRLGAHLETFIESLSSAGPVGRRLDFLAQEIHRELNTLGAKCRDSTMAQWVVDAKLACEQLREQVQNVE